MVRMWVLQVPNRPTGKNPMKSIVSQPSTIKDHQPLEKIPPEIPVNPRKTGWWLSPTPLKNMTSSVGVTLPNIYIYMEGKS